MRSARSPSRPICWRSMPRSRLRALARPAAIFAVVADEVRDLSGRTAQFSKEILEVMSQMRERVQKTEAAISRMASQDMGFAVESKEQVQSVFGQVERLNREHEESIEKLARHAGLLEAEVNRSVKALQFHDSVSQLVMHMPDGESTRSTRWAPMRSPCSATGASCTSRSCSGRAFRRPANG